MIGKYKGCIVVSYINYMHGYNDRGNIVTMHIDGYNPRFNCENRIFFSDDQRLLQVI